MWKSKSKNKGFTLIEIVIAIVLLSLIALSASIAIRIGLKSYEKTRTTFEKTKSKEINTLFLFEQIKLTSDYRWKGKIYNLFEGSRDKIIFISKKSILNPSKYGFFKVRYEEDEGKLWVSEEQIFDPSDVNREIKEEPTPFIKDVLSVQFRFFDGKNWNDSWYSKQLPQAIYVNIEWKNKKNTEMIIPIVIDRTLEISQ